MGVTSAEQLHEQIHYGSGSFGDDIPGMGPLENRMSKRTFLKLGLLGLSGGLGACAPKGIPTPEPTGISELEVHPTGSPFELVRGAAAQEAADALLTNYGVAIDVVMGLKSPIAIGDKKYELLYVAGGWATPADGTKSNSPIVDVPILQTVIKTPEGKYEFVVFEPGTGGAGKLHKVTRLSGDATTMVSYEKAPGSSPFAELKVKQGSQGKNVVDGIMVEGKAASINDMSAATEFFTTHVWGPAADIEMVDWAQKPWMMKLDAGTLNPDVKDLQKILASVDRTQVHVVDAYLRHNGQHKDSPAAADTLVILPIETNLGEHNGLLSSLTGSLAIIETKTINAAPAAQGATGVDAKPSMTKQAEQVLVPLAAQLSGDYVYFFDVNADSSNPATARYALWLKDGNYYSIMDDPNTDVIDMLPMVAGTGVVLPQYEQKESEEIKYGGATDPTHKGGGASGLREGLNFIVPDAWKAPLSADQMDPNPLVPEGYIDTIYQTGKLLSTGETITATIAEVGATFVGIQLAEPAGDGWTKVDRYVAGFRVSDPEHPNIFYILTVPISDSKTGSSGIDIIPNGTDDPAVGAKVDLNVSGHGVGSQKVIDILQKPDSIGRRVIITLLVADSNSHPNFDLSYLPDQARLVKAIRNGQSINSGWDIRTQVNNIRLPHDMTTQ